MATFAPYVTVARYTCWLCHLDFWPIYVLLPRYHVTTKTW